jgi:hypothetical protein
MIRGGSVSVSLQNKLNLIEYNSLYSNIFESQSSKELLLQTAVSYKSNELRIMTISPHFILYEVSYAKYQFIINTTKILIPNNVFSNIIGGGGLFVGYTLNRIAI